MSGFYYLMLSLKKERTVLQTTSVSHRFSTLSVASMIEIYEITRKFIMGCISCDILGHIQRQTANSYPPAYPGCHCLCPQVLSRNTLTSVCSSPSVYWSTRLSLSAEMDHYPSFKERKMPTIQHDWAIFATLFPLKLSPFTV